MHDPCTQDTAAGIAHAFSGRTRCLCIPQRSQQLGQIVDTLLQLSMQHVRREPEDGLA